MTEVFTTVTWSKHGYLGLLACKVLFLGLCYWELFSTSCQLRGLTFVLVFDKLWNCY